MQQVGNLAIRGTSTGTAAIDKRRWFIGWILLPAMVTHAQPPTHTPSTQTWGTTVDGLQLSIAFAEPAKPSLPAFAISIRNVAARDINVFLGTAPAGLHSPEQIQLSLVDASGKHSAFRFLDRRFAGIAGGLSYFVVPLASNSSYTLKFNLDDFWLRDMTRDATSFECPCRIEAVFEGIAVSSQWANVRLPTLWTGTLRSNTLELTNSSPPQ